MGRQLNPLEKEFLVKTFKARNDIKLRDFCNINGISDTSMRKWIQQYDKDGLEGLSRSSEYGDILPEGIEHTDENYRREILKLRIENERLKKNYTVQKNEDGQTVFIRLSPKNTK